MAQTSRSIKSPGHCLRPVAAALLAWLTAQGAVTHAAVPKSIASPTFVASQLEFRHAGMSANGFALGRSQVAAETPSAVRIASALSAGGAPRCTSAAAGLSDACFPTDSLDNRLSYGTGRSDRDASIAPSVDRDEDRVFLRRFSGAMGVSFVDEHSNDSDLESANEALGLLPQAAEMGLANSADQPWSRYRTPTHFGPGILVADSSGTLTLATLSNNELSALGSSGDPCLGSSGCPAVTPTLSSILVNSVVIFEGSKWRGFIDNYELLGKYPSTMTVHPELFERGIGATFIPGEGLTLARAAAVAGVDHFNWFQLVGPRSSETGGIDFSQPDKIALDPILRCYQSLADWTGNPCPNRDDLPYYLDEQFTIDGRRVYERNGQRVGPGQTRLESWTADLSTLLFSDAPTVERGFQTCLVGVRADSSLLLMQFSDLPSNPICFSWASQDFERWEDGALEDFGSGASTYSFIGYKDGGAFSEVELQLLRTAGVVFEVLDVQTNVPEPSSLSISGLALLAILTARRRLRLGCWLHRAQN